MVFVLPERAPKKTFGSEFGSGLGQGLSYAAQLGMQEAQNHSEAKKEASFLKNIYPNFDWESASPQMRQKAFESAFSQQPKQLNPLQESQLDLNIAKQKELEYENELFSQILEKKPENLIPQFESEVEDVNPKVSKPSSNISKFSDEKLRELSSFKGKQGPKGVLGTMAQNELDRRLGEEKKITEKGKEERKAFEADREYHSKVSRPIIEAANERLKSSDIEKAVSQQLRNQIESGNTSGLFPFMVDKMGLESFRNPESAIFSNAVKNLFIGSLNEIPGARPNMFIEKFLSTAQPLIGRSVEANSAVMDINDFVRDVADEQARKELEIAKEDQKKYGYAKEDMTQRAREKMGDYVNRRQEKMAIDIRKRHEKNLDNDTLLAEIISGDIIPGTYVTPRMMKLFYIKNDNDIDRAIQDIKGNGMKFPEYLD